MRPLGDRRSRIRLEVVGSLWGTLESDRQAKLLNISRTGALIVSPVPAAVDSTQSVRVTIEGHADARGTNEYNFALSERRAASVRDYLVSLGVAASRLAIVSKGEEQPTCTEETEACHTNNRRGHFVFTAK